MKRSIGLAAALALVTMACGSTPDESLDTLDEVDQPIASDAPDESGTTAPGEPVDEQPVDSEPSAAEPDTTDPDTDDVATTTPSPISVSPNANPDLQSSSVPPNPAVEPPTPVAEGFDLDQTNPLVTDAVTDLADRLGIEGADITVVTAKAVSWGDSSLGCPVPGMQYLQAVTDGSEVVLDAAGDTYRYTGGSPLVLCEQPARPADG